MTRIAKTLHCTLSTQLHLDTMALRLSFFHLIYLPTRDFRHAYPEFSGVTMDQGLGLGLFWRGDTYPRGVIVVRTSAALKPHQMWLSRLQNSASKTANVSPMSVSSVSPMASELTGLTSSGLKN
jgi:hypothetical protein